MTKVAKVTFDYEVIPYSEKHRDAIAELETKYFSSPWSKKAIEDFVLGATSFIFVAVTEENVIGYVSFYYAADEGYIANIAVDEKYRNNGVAGALIDRTIVLCREKGLSSLGLEVRESNLGATKLYKSKNFTLVGKRKRFYKLPDEDAMLFTLFL